MRTRIFIITMIGLLAQAASSVAHARQTLDQACVLTGPVRSVAVNGEPLDLVNDMGYFGESLAVGFDDASDHRDLITTWLEPVVANGMLEAATLIVEVTGEDVLRGAHVGFYISGSEDVSLAILVLDLKPGFGQIHVVFEPILLPENEPSLLYAALDPAKMIDEYSENNNLISTGLVPDGSASYCLTPGNSFSHKRRYCGDEIGWSGRAFYRSHAISLTQKADDGHLDMDQAHLAGGYLYYTITHLASQTVVDSDMVRTDDQGYWHIDTGLPTTGSDQYRLRLQLGDAGLVDETTVFFEHATCSRPGAPHHRSGFLPQIACAFDQTIKSDLAVEPPRFDEINAMAGRPVTLSARVAGDSPWKCVPVAWEIYDGRGLRISRSPVDYFSLEGETYVSITFTPPAPDHYRVVVSLEDIHDDNMANNQSQLDLDIWQEQLPLQTEVPVVDRWQKYRPKPMGHHFYQHKEEP